jgi:hypothetical protein
LDGSASADADTGQTISYAWVQIDGPTVVLSDAKAVKPSFTAPTLAAGAAAQTLTFGLVVTDNQTPPLSSVQSTVVVTVSSPAVVTEVSINSEGFESNASAVAPTNSTVPANSTTEVEISVALKGAGGVPLTSGGNVVLASVDMGNLRGAQRTSAITRSVSAYDPSAGLTRTPKNTPILMHDNGNGTYSVWLSSSSAGVATVAVTVDGRAAGTKRVVFTTNSVPAIVTKTQTDIASFMLTRANSLASNQPSLTRLLMDKGCGELSAQATLTAGSANGCVAAGNSWVSLSSAWSNTGSYTLGTLGAHRAMNPNLLLGAMVQVDSSRDSATNASGRGWMAGPYFVAKLADQPMYFEGRLLYGKSNNQISPLGVFEDKFDTTRVLAQIKATGSYKMAALTLMPNLGFTMMQDTQATYTDSLTNTIAGQTIRLTQMNAGLDFSRAMAAKTGAYELTSGFAAVYSGSSEAEVKGQFATWRGRVHLGLAYDSGKGGSFRLNGFVDGLGTAYQNAGANLMMQIKF